MVAVIWKPVPSCPGTLASSEGMVLFPPKSAPLHHGGYRHYITKPTKGAIRRAKKAAAHVYYGAYHKDYGNVKIHQMICEAFHGPKPFPEAVVIHKDENGLNNKPGNLKWGTQKENLNMPKFKEWLRSPERNQRIMAGKRRAKARRDEAA
jgi:hypothetical protein